MTSWRPGKGAHLMFNDDLLTWYRDAMSDIAQAYEVTGGDEGQDNDPKQVLRALLLKEEYADKVDLDLEWTLEKDKFGSKVFTSKEAGDGQYRITLVLTSRGTLALDIRNWFDADNV